MFNRPQNTNCQMIKLFKCSQIHVMGNIVFALITHKIVKHIRYCLISLIFLKKPCLVWVSLAPGREEEPRLQRELIRQPSWCRHIPALMDSGCLLHNSTQLKFKRQKTSKKSCQWFFSSLSVSLSPQTPAYLTDFESVASLAIWFSFGGAPVLFSSLIHSLLLFFWDPAILSSL